MNVPYFKPHNKIRKYKSCLDTLHETALCSTSEENGIAVPVAEVNRSPFGWLSNASPDERMHANICSEANSS